ncbi:hypothetical protein KCP74_23005 [Salmonella enterica subsp. enterica]|nr:hypothetical protein KCP74_23005 [Salmonella enterica subsp. enterica]
MLSYFSQMAGLIGAKFPGRRQPGTCGFAIRAFARMCTRWVMPGRVHALRWDIISRRVNYRAVLSNKAYRKTCRLISPSPIP